MLILAQSDTTVGYLSASKEQINRVKHRPLDQEVLQLFSSFKALSKHTRVPLKHHRMVRRARKTTFILSNHKAFRIVSDVNAHHKVVDKFSGFYSSSANITKKAFDEKEAWVKADMIIKDPRGFYEDQASTMIKLSRTSKRRLR